MRKLQLEKKNKQKHEVQEVIYGKTIGEYI